MLVLAVKRMRAKHPGICRCSFSQKPHRSVASTGTHHRQKGKVMITSMWP